MLEAKTFTYQARLETTAEQNELLTAFAALHGKVERSLFAKTMAGGRANKDDKNAAKRSSLQEFGITARQYNSIILGLEGKIKSIKERRQGLIREADQRITTAKKVIARLEKKAPGTNTLHQKKRRLTILEARLTRLRSDHKAGTVRVCFGSKKLFRAQFDLVANDYADHAAWHADWQARRAQEFALLGSKDETSGNQSCTASVGCTGAITLRLRLPDALAGENHDSRYLGLSGISFAYGQEPLFRALAGRQAISYRFVRDTKGWRVFASFDVAAPAQASNRRLGALGVDMNADHLAVSETDRFGNLVATQKIPSVTYGKNSEQRRATLGEAAKVVATWAERVGKPVVLEDLDFSKKKSEFERTGIRKARMLSALSFLAGRASIEAACFRRGVEIIGENPAYTSVIGAVNHACRRGISVHQGAALALARRGLSFQEKPAMPVGLVPVGNGGHVTFVLPVRNRAKHVWSHWADILRNSRAAHAAHFRSGGALLAPEPLSPAMRTLRSIRGVSVESRQANKDGFSGAVRQQNCSAAVLD